MDAEIIEPGAVKVDLGEFRLIPGPKGETGEQGPRGYGLRSAVLNPDYTLTLNYENGDSYTTRSVRGEAGVGIESFRQTEGDHAPGTSDVYTLTLTDGREFSIPVYNGRDGGSR